MGISLAFHEDSDKLQDRLQCLRYLATHTVEVGLTSSASGRSRTLLAIHEHGSPAMHIPARPVVKPALAKPSVRAEMGQAMMNACAAALDGDMYGLTAALEESGRAGVDGIHAYIDAGNPSASSMVVAPHRGANSLSLDLTSDEDSRHHRGDRSLSVDLTSFETSATGGQKEVRPLVDTGQMYNDFDWEITGK